MRVVRLTQRPILQNAFHVLWVPYGTRARRLVSLVIPDLACPITSLLVSHYLIQVAVLSNQQLYKGMRRWALTRRSLREFSWGTFVCVRVARRVGFVGLVTRGRTVRGTSWPEREEDGFLSIHLRKPCAVLLS